MDIIGYIKLNTIKNIPDAKSDDKIVNPNKSPSINLLLDKLAPMLPKIPNSKKIAIILKIVKQIDKIPKFSSEFSRAIIRIDKKFNPRENI